MNRFSRSMWFWMGVALLVILEPQFKVAASGVGPGSYTVTDLGDFGGGESEAYDINASGQVTGQAYDAEPENWAFLYDNGVLTNLQAPRGNNPDGTPAYRGIASSGWAINALGQVTGMYLNCPFNVLPCPTAQHPFLYSNGTIIDIGLGLSGAGVAINDVGDVAGSVNVTGGAHGFVYSGGVTTDFGAVFNLPYTSPTAINHSAEVVGLSSRINQLTNQTEQQDAFFYSNGVMTDVTPGGGDAWGINDAGQMTGFYYTTGGITYHAYIYSSATGAFNDLGSLNGASGASRGYAINAAGQVTGVSDVPNPYGDSHAFLYSPGTNAPGTMIDLGTLGGSTSWPGNDFYTHSINATGQVVGTSYLAGDRVKHAFLYNVGDAVMTDLNSLIPSDSGWTLQVANAINDNGQITGYGLINGERHAFLLTRAGGTATLQSIAVTPVNPSITVGTTQGFVATGTYSDGTTKDLTSAVTWAASNASITASINAAGVATGVGAGNSTITATLNGVQGSTALTITPFASTTTLASSVDPSSPNQGVTFTATVVGYNFASSFVTFKDGSTTLGIVPYHGTGTATLIVTSLLIGTHSITATYLGDNNNLPSTSEVLIQGVNKTISTTSLTASANPLTVGHTVILTATVTGVVPTGTVTFTVDGGAEVNGPVLLNNGTARISLNGLSPGPHTIVVSYSGDGGNFASSSPVFTEVVNTGAGRVPTTTTLTVSTNTPALGGTVTLTATVTGAAPTGTVTFYEFNNVLAVVAIGPNGTASTTLTVQNQSAHQITVAYSGDGNNLPSTSMSQKVQAR